MAVFDWPAYGSDKAFWPETVEPKRVHNNRIHESPLSGDVQTQGVPGARLGWALNFPEQPWDERSRLWAFLSRLDGMAHRVRLFDPHLPRPAGSINLTGVTLAAGAGQFATTLQLAGCGNTRTLLPGDWISPNGQQLVQVVAAATSSSGGAMTVEFRHPLRAAVSGGQAVVLDQPTALYILVSPEIGTAYGAGNRARPLSIEFREVFA